MSEEITNDLKALEREEDTSIGSLQEEIQKLKTENLKLRTEKVSNVPVSTPDETVSAIVERVLGTKFVFRILGFGQFQLLEIEVPEELVDSAVLERKQVFPKNHPRAKEVMGDVRSCRIGSEQQIENWLNLVKEEIVTRFRNNHAPQPIFE